MGNRSKQCSNLKDTTFTKLINQLEDSTIGKKSVLVIHKILRMFVNILTADDKHYLLNRENLTKPIQIPLPQRANIFSEFFFFLF